MVLVGREYWQGLIDWMKESALAMGNISPEDLELMHIVDEPEEVCAIINQRYRDRLSDFQPEKRDKTKKGV